MDKRRKWTDEEIRILKELWPHWGTLKLAEMTNKSKRMIKTKVDKLFLKKLPKKERKCISCDTGYQERRSNGFYCKKCFSEKRKVLRSNTQKPREIWMKELLRTLKYRSKEQCDISVEHLMELWDNQKGLCVYSCLEMREPIFYGKGRSYYAASLDRIDSSRGYLKGNVVWCCWGCNIAKQNFEIEEFLENCELIAKNKNHVMEFSQNIKTQYPIEPLPI